ncbi:MAG TPA: alpha/beta fold hydrolase [Opitutaceae bacterium]|nr:alpha/beta fold hydrolase [Opitutaceae bacterium]
MRLFHRDLGTAGLPPLVILHGLLGSSRNWQTAGRDLASRHHVYALDLRNHGASPHSAEMTYAAMLADVLEWFGAQGLAKATVVGHSMGGKVAMLLACRHPERVERLIVVDTAPRGYRSPGLEAQFAAMTSLGLDTLQSRAEAEQRLEGNVPDWAARKFLTTNLAQDPAGHWHWSVNLPVLHAALPELGKNPLASNDRYTGPSLFIAGGKSRFLLTADHAPIAAHFPQARFEVIPGAAHNPHMETREAFVHAVG